MKFQTAFLTFFIPGALGHGNRQEVATEHAPYSHVRRNLHKGHKLNEFQLKMFWEEGMMWQESSTEKAWCCECYDNCSAGEKVVIKECDKFEEGQKWTYEEEKIKSIVNRDLCFTFFGDLTLEICSESQNAGQELSGIRSNNEFQLHPKTDSDECLTQPHHPKEGEKLRMSSCKGAYHNDPGVYDDTSHWVIGVFDGH